jgi:hypothetical protein
MSETPTEITREYARQIVAAVRDHTSESGDVTYLVTELLREYGAKAYQDGRQHLADQIATLV